MICRLPSRATLLVLPFLLLTGPLHAQEADTTATDTTATDTTAADTTRATPMDTTAAAMDTTAADSLVTDTLSAAERRERDQEQARTSAESWLSLTDAGTYGESWDEAAPSLQEAIPREDWIERGEEARSTLGDLKSRNLVQAKYRDSTAQLPTEGPVVTLEYETEFANVTAREALVTVKQDTVWKVAGYRIVRATEAPSDTTDANP